ncbi:L-threonylcarbamoyladenylate synthase [Robiginitalea sp. IMCC43444]|uniref:L-threonylcarbamoyladenylate synthase n=1 Tax=Robiginitalea sp. IMCC43444 TaxID=3459121 RepID=UPI0040414D18
MALSETDSIKKAASCIQKGGVVAFPTETVYGLGADALNPLAVARIFELKERPSFDPLIVHIADIGMLPKLAASDDDRIGLLAEAFWPGPLTLVLPKMEVIPDIVTSGLPTVGIRMPNHPVALQLIREAGCPIAAPSANKFGRISPTEAHHVQRNLPEADFILEGGPTRVGIESTIIRLNADGFQILRPGVITASDLAEVLPESREPLAEGLPAPGMLESHYSPETPFYLYSPELADTLDWSKAGLISYSLPEDKRYAKYIRLTKTADLTEYASRMFGAMHEMENAGLDCIVAEAVPEEGIGKAIMDRLRKAAHNYRR